MSRKSLPIDTSINKSILKSEKFPLSEAIKLRIEHHLTFQEIADHYGVSRQAVHNKLKKFIRILGEPELNDTYREQRTGLLNGVERVLIENILDSKKLKDASLNNIAYAFQQIHNARRLEEEKSTANIVMPLIIFERVEQPAKQLPDEQDIIDVEVTTK